MAHRRFALWNLAVGWSAPRCPPSLPLVIWEGGASWGDSGRQLRGLRAHLRPAGAGYAWSEKPFWVIPALKASVCVKEEWAL